MLGHLVIQERSRKLSKGIDIQQQAFIPCREAEQDEKTAVIS